MRKSCVSCASFPASSNRRGNKNINGKINSQKELKKGGKNIGVQHSAGERRNVYK